MVQKVLKAILQLFHNLWKFSSPNDCVTSSNILVDRNILGDEICVRCLFKPMMQKNKKPLLHHPAVLPPPNESVVSVLRLRYISEETAISHGKSLTITGNRFWGLAQFTQNIVNSVNHWAQSSESCTEGMDGPNGIRANIISSPMVNANEYVPDDHDVYMNDSTIVYPLHAHAELKFDCNLNEDVKTRMRQYANQLIKQIDYKLLNDDGSWSGWYRGIRS